jgi:hypothetical protein
MDYDGEDYRLCFPHYDSISLVNKRPSDFLHFETIDGY